MKTIIYTLPAEERVLYTAPGGGPVVFSRPAGQLAVVTPIRNTDPEPETLTDAEIEQRAWDKLPADAINPRFVDAANLPEGVANRAFRAAWRDTGTVVHIDMTAAREVRRSALRAERAPVLAALDIDYQRADESGDTAAKAAIAAKKKALRDITGHPGIASAKTIEDLLAIVLPNA